VFIDPAAKLAGLWLIIATYTCSWMIRTWHSDVKLFKSDPWHIWPHVSNALAQRLEISWFFVARFQHNHTLTRTYPRGCLTGILFVSLSISAVNIALKASCAGYARSITRFTLRANVN